MFAGTKCAFPSGEGGAPQGVTDEEKSEQYIEFQIVFPYVRANGKSLLLEEKVDRVSETDVVFRKNKNPVCHPERRAKLGVELSRSDEGAA